MLPVLAGASWIRDFLLLIEDVTMRCALFYITAAIFCGTGLCASGEVFTKTFDEDDSPIANPGQGWMAWRRTGWDESRAKVAVGIIYERFYWSDLEPDNGVYDWTQLDGLLEFAASKGVPAAFRIVCAASGVPKNYETPKWVFELGAKGDAFVSKTANGSVNDFVPRFDDPIFLKYHARFIRRLAEHCDGDPRLAGLDLGSYGNWGEWHCCHLPPFDNGKGGQTIYPFAARKAIIDAYLDNFKKTTVVAMTDNEEGLAYAVQDGLFPRVGLRRDGVGAPWIQKDWSGSVRYAEVRNMGDVWKSKPVWFESYASAGWMVEKKGWDMTAMVDWMESNHVTCVHYHPLAEKDSPEFSELWRRVDMVAGARLVPKRAVVSVADTGFSVKLGIVNKGVSCIALPYDVVFELIDGNGCVFRASHGCADPAKWLPGRFVLEEDVPATGGEMAKSVALRIRLVHRGRVLRDFRFAAKGAEKGLIVWERGREQ